MYLVLNKNYTKLGGWERRFSRLAQGLAINSGLMSSEYKSLHLKMYLFNGISEGWWIDRDSVLTLKEIEYEGNTD